MRITNQAKCSSEVGLDNKFSNFQINMKEFFGELKLSKKILKIDKILWDNLNYSTTLTTVMYIDLPSTGLSPMGLPTTKV